MKTANPAHNQGTSHAFRQNEYPISASLPEAHGQPVSGRWQTLASLWLRAYLFVWAATLVPSAVVALTGPPLVDPTRHLLGLALDPQRNPPPDVGHVLLLAAHNLPIAAWPLLLGAWGAHRNRAETLAADALMLVVLLVNTSQVGAALGAYGTRLLPYLSNLPLEWAGIALGASAWLAQRRHPMTTRRALTMLVLIALVLLGAAVLETVAVPHRA
jgi:hypothetical protein